MATQEALTREECGYFEDEDGTIRIEDLVIQPARPPTLSYDAPESRLMITELIVEDFKSYAGKQTLGPFNKHFTSIVGPNGSGKSNVIDSLLFVFGARARKIRSKTIKQLIHDKGGRKRCSVTVNFAIIRDEGEGYSVIPDSRFILSRTAFIDDTSYYEIMHKRVPYKEVNRTLKAYGIDMDHTRFLILQGEIEAISLLQPKAATEHDEGMLEYIEDIIGSDRFIEPIKTFTEKINLLNEEKKLKVNEAKIFESEKDKLEEPKNQAIQYLRLENQTFIIENSILHLKRKEAEHELQVVSEKKKDLVSTMRDVKKQMDDLADSKHSVQKELEKVTHDLENSYKNFEKYKEEFKKQECKDASLSEEFKYAKTKKSNLQDSLEKYQKELGKLEKQLNVYESETKELEVLLKKLEAEKEVEDKKSSEVLGSLQKETNALKEKKDKFENQLVKSKEICNEIRSEMNLLQSERDIYTSSQKKEKDKLNSLVSDLEKNTTVTAAEEKLMKKDEEYIAKLESDLESLKNQLLNSKNEEQNLSQELKLKRIKLEEAKSSMTSTQSRNQMINAFRKEKAQGRFTGVYGRLGDLGAIDQKYDVAISTACGPLDNIVTDTMNTAQKCVEFLKKNNLGYTTFLPLEKMEKWTVYVNKKIQTPENVPRLFDLITVNDKALLPAFYYALRDTLVADTLEQATRIGLQGKHRFRVVTLRGDLIDLAGTMSGGGAKMMRGRMGQKIVECTTSDADVANMNSEINALTKKLSEIKKLCVNLENQIYEKNKVLVTAQRNAKKRIANVASYKEAIQVLKSQIADQEIKIASVVIDDNKVKGLDEKIKQKKKDYENAMEKSSSIEKEVSSLRDEILSITKGKSKKAEKNLLQLNKQLQEKTQSMTKSTVNIKSSKRNIDKTKKTIASTEKEIEDLTKSLIDVKEKRKELEDQARETHEKKLEAEKQIEEFKGKKANLKKGIEEINEKEHQLKLLDIERKNELKNLEALESEKKLEIKAINAKLTKLKLNEVENDSTDIPTLTADDISKLSMSKLYSDLDLLKLQMEEIKPNFSAIKEFRIKEQQFLEKQSLVDTITHQINIENFRLTELQDKRLSEFNAGFSIIANKLREVYQMLTLGGDAEIQSVKNAEPFAEGIEYHVRPPKKAWKYMRNLSGGEKTLASLALVFALHYYRPTPFYVMDEIDAALDERNVAIIAYYLKEQTKNAQLVVVSLRNVMNELSDQLLGIFKVNDCTKFLNLTNVSSWAEEGEENQRTSAQSVGET
ncbi:structural maintenance of chromosomes protein 4-like [Uloborus diversus]|uniref:structural maintenance of chromosomes protein 4-like n=1 Tax=Uloborus diversus TaxID=327109 RepID=UPI002409EEC3|nr:structural maintenance of chromosomes protein 4-like [Uloborus diversus]